MNQSIKTIQSPEFIDLQPLDINPLMSKCSIKVLYVGANRNESFITKEVASEMAKTLRGAPIVGYYKKEKEDFRDHGRQIILEDNEIKFDCLTKPYGFVAPNAEVWFQTFIDIDDFGNETEREYLMTTGYLWTGQYEESKLAIEEGRPQSMELDENTLKGTWKTNPKTNMDFFIINDAIFSKLCILGDDVEPCFEGASVTAAEPETTFTKVDTNFKRTLFTMMKELEHALSTEQKVETEVNTEVSQEDSTDSATATTAEVQEEASNEVVEENAETVEEVTTVTEEETEVEQAEEATPTEVEQPVVENSDAQPQENQSYSLLQKDYELLQTNYNSLQDKYSNLEKEYLSLVEFRKQIEDAEKDEMINKFYFLSDEDKKDVIENKANYTVNEIESKLSVICVRKKVNFNLDDSAKKENNMEDAPIFTYTMKDESTSEPAWVTAVKNTQNKNN